MERLIEEFPNRMVAYAVVSITILLIGFIVNRILLSVVNKFFKRNSERLDLDPTTFSFFRNATNAIMLVVVIMIIFYTIPELKSVGVALFASAGIFAAIVGFASQQAFSNIISGIFLVIFRPFRVNDTVTIGDKWGVIEDITLRHTIIRNFENRRIIIPNAVVSQESIINSNLKDQKIRVNWNVGISYSANIDLAYSIIEREAAAHPLFLDNRTDEEKKNGEPKVIIRTTALAESSVMLRAYIWAKDPDDAWEMTCDLNKSIKQAFDKEGIEIPFPQRTIHIKNSD